jgi:hypothetical protein
VMRGSSVNKFLMLLMKIIYFFTDFSTPPKSYSRSVMFVLT